MKPFNLERALTGDAVVYRCGRTPLAFHYFAKANKKPVLTVDLDGDVLSHFEDGVYMTDRQESSFDLFMAPQTVTEWILLIDSSPSCHGPFNTKEDAEDYKSRLPRSNHLTVAKIEYEE